MDPLNCITLKRWGFCSCLINIVIEDKMEKSGLKVSILELQITHELEQGNIFH